jgi:hypothetical protein
MLEDDRYVEMIRRNRTEVRANAVISMIELLIENDRIDGLEYNVGIDKEVRDDPGTVVPLVEAYVAKEFRRWAGTMRIALSTEGIYKYPGHAVRLMEFILEYVDDHEDPDSLLTMALSGEPPTFVLENMTRFAFGDPGIHLEEIIEHVEPAVMLAITNILSVRSKEGVTDELDRPRFTRLANFVRTFPDMPDAALYMEAPITTTQDDLMSQMVKTESMDENMFLVRNAVGMTVFYHADYATGFPQLEHYFDALNANGADRMSLLEVSASHLKTIYEVSADAQARLSEAGL